MIRRLRRKFIFIAGVSIAGILCLVLGTVNSMNYISSFSETMSILRFITENSGRMPNHRPERQDIPLTAESPYEIRYFSVLFDTDGSVMSYNDEHIAAVTDVQVTVLAAQAQKNFFQSGYLNYVDSSYAYMIQQVDAQQAEKMLEYGTIPDSTQHTIDESQSYTAVVFMDCTNRLRSANRFAKVSVIVGLTSFVACLILLSFLSGRIIAPVAQSYEKQKEFITNAGHELKTPLAVIQANTETIELIQGETEFSRSTLRQVKRLSGLISNLIALARIEEADAQSQLELEDFDLSAAAQEVAEEMSTVAQAQGKSFEAQIAEGVICRGNGKMLRELCSILADNAVKYCDEGGTVVLSLQRSGKARVLLSVTNPYADGEGVDYSRFFERFYRAEQSHNQEKAAGHGIGLSMAQTIVALHKGKITAKYANGAITFVVNL